MSVRSCSVCVRDGGGSVDCHRRSAPRQCPRRDDGFHCRRCCRTPRAAVFRAPPVVAVHKRQARRMKASRRRTDASCCPAFASAGPYKVTATLAGFSGDTKESGHRQSRRVDGSRLQLKVAGFRKRDRDRHHRSGVSTSRTGAAATALTRDDLASLPTVSGRITDITACRRSYGGSGTFVGQDNARTTSRSTARTSTARSSRDDDPAVPRPQRVSRPFSLEASSKSRSASRPMTCRQGNFVGANVNTVTRSGANITGSLYTRLPQPVVQSARKPRGSRSTPACSRQERARMGAARS